VYFNILTLMVMQPTLGSACLLSGFDIRKHDNGSAHIYLVPDFLNFYFGSNSESECGSGSSRIQVLINKITKPNFFTFFTIVYIFVNVNV